MCKRNTKKQQHFHIHLNSKRCTLLVTHLINHRSSDELCPVAYPIKHTMYRLMSQQTLFHCNKIACYILGTVLYKIIINN